MNPLVAIIVPTFNVSLYIEECLNSLRNQSYQDFIAVIADDGSTDNTVELIKEWREGDHRFKLLELPHLGVSATRNAALNYVDKIQEVEYILFLDSDDLLNNKCIERAVKNCQSTNSDLCVFAYTPFNLTGQAWSHNPPKTLTLNSSEEIASYYWNFETSKFIEFQKTQSSFLCNRLFKKSVIKGLRFDEKVSLGEDQIFILTALPSIRRAVIDSYNGYLYRQRASSATHSIRPETSLNPLYFHFKNIYIEHLNSNTPSYNMLEGLLQTMNYWLWQSAISEIKNKNSIFSHRWRTLKRESKWVKKILREKITLKERKRLFLMSQPLIFKVLYSNKVKPFLTKPNKDEAELFK